MVRTKSEQARTKMIEAALEIVHESGIDNVTVAEIVKRSGVAKTTFYRHFTSLSELILIACSESIQPFPIPNTGSLRTDLEALATMMLPVLCQPERQQMAASVLHAGCSDPDIAALHKEISLEQRAPIKAVLDMAQQRGEIGPDVDIDLACEFVEGPFIKRIHFTQTELTEKDVVGFLDLICHGLFKK